MESLIHSHFRKHKSIQKEDNDEDVDVAAERRRVLRGSGKKDLLRLENLTKVCCSPFTTQLQEGSGSVVERLTRDRNLQISAILPYGRGIVPYIIFLTIETDISLHFLRFKYHSFSVKVNIIFKTNEKVPKKTQKA